MFKIKREMELHIKKPRYTLTPWGIALYQIDILDQGYKKGCFSQDGSWMFDWCYEHYGYYGMYADYIKDNKDKNEFYINYKKMI
jgi:hypothetical protein